MDIRLIEEYPCLNGESLWAGRTAYLVRCGGCNLRCPYCDTRESWARGEAHEVTAVAGRAAASGMAHVLLTGGEPMLQPQAAAALCREALGHGLDVAVETNGTLDLALLPEEVTRVVDLKPPGAAPAIPFLLSNLQHLRPQDQLKIVLTGRDDLLWALDWLAAHPLPIPDHHVLLSPAAPELAATDLADWIRDRCLPYRLHLQLHRLLWGDRRGV